MCLILCVSVVDYSAGDRRIAKRRKSITACKIIGSRRLPVSKNSTLKSSPITTVDVALAAPWYKCPSPNTTAEIASARVKFSVQGHM